MSSPTFSTLLRISAAAALLVFSFAPAYGQRALKINEVQGPENVSPHLGQNVMLTGVVTARIPTGFFIQSPDAEADENPNTSEGIFVFTRETPDKSAMVGSMVSVSGKVEEYRRSNEPNSLTITELVHQKGRDKLSVISKDNALPLPKQLTVEDFKPNALDQLERYEGMRVTAAELVAVSPTDGRVNIASGTAESNGSFYAVLGGISRPFREPGLEIAEIIFADDKERDRLRTSFPKLTIFDMNPERLRVESSQQEGAKPLDLSVGTAIKDATGVLHYSYRVSTLILDPIAKIQVSGGIQPAAMPVPGAGEFSVVALNIENFFDDRDDPAINEPVVDKEGFRRRLRKISSALRDVLKSPDVLGLVEIENQNAVDRLAEQLNRDSVDAGQPDPKYKGFVIEGNDGRGIDNALLVKTSRVNVVEIAQLGKNERYKHPTTGEEILLNDRPALMLRASIEQPNLDKPFAFTVIVNHLKSYLGYNDPRQQENVRLKKKLQAEFLARAVNERQKADPQEKLMVIGDLNSYQFSDGVLDMVGTIAGSPSAADSVLIASPDLVEPNLINLVDLINVSQRYSYIFDGNAQTLDHFLVSANLRPHLIGFGFARVNADHPELLRNDASRPERFSDHDPAAAYFSVMPRN